MLLGLILLQIWVTTMYFKPSSGSPSASYHNFCNKNKYTWRCRVNQCKSNVSWNKSRGRIDCCQRSGSKGIVVVYIFWPAVGTVVMLSYKSAVPLGIRPCFTDPSFCIRTGRGTRRDGLSEKVCDIYHFMARSMRISALDRLPYQTINSVNISNERITVNQRSRIACHNLQSINGISKNDSTIIVEPIISFVKSISRLKWCQQSSATRLQKTALIPCQMPKTKSLSFEVINKSSNYI